MGDRQPGDSLPRASDAQIDPATLSTYLMDPSNPGNGGKWEAFAAVGYDVHDSADRAAGADDVVAQLRAQLAGVPALEGRVSAYGRRFEVRTGRRGPNGTEGTLVTVCQLDSGGGVPRLITNWLEVHR